MPQMNRNESLSPKFVLALITATRLLSLLMLIIAIKDSPKCD